MGNIREAAYHLSPEKARITPAIDIHLGGRDIKFHRVAHHIDTLDLHPEYFEKIVEEADLIILECAPTAEGVYTKEVQSKLVACLNDLGSDITLEELRKNLEENKLFQFFNKLEEMAAGLGKTIVTVDPAFLEDAQTITRRGQYVELAKNAGAGGSLILLIQKLLSGLTAREEAIRQNAAPPKMTRRKLLKLGILAGIGAASGLSIHADHPGGKDMNAQGRTRGIAGPTAFDETDYRDVVIAEGLEKLAHSELAANTGHGSLAAIYGATHGAPIKFYTEHRAERQARIEVYKRTIGHNIHPKLRAYKNINGIWIKKMEEDIV